MLMMWSSAHVHMNEQYDPGNLIKNKDKLINITGSRMTRQSSSGSTVRSHSLNRMAEYVCDEHLPYPQLETGEHPGNCASGAEGGQIYHVPHPPSQSHTNSSTVSIHSMRDENRAAKHRFVDIL